MDKWYNLNGLLRKNPSKEDINKLPVNQVIFYAKGINGIVREQWWVDIDRKTVLDFAYSVNEKNVGYLRDLHFKSYDIKPSFIRGYFLPPSWINNKGVRIP